MLIVTCTRLFTCIVIVECRSADLFCLSPGKHQYSLGRRYTTFHEHVVIDYGHYHTKRFLLQIFKLNVSERKDFEHKPYVLL